ncbi:MAG: hypothetical protein OEY23_10070 [Acidimicrobiia bacterium]|nr:hypothetical protein [Acidimicrobiia bacterium]
MGPAVVVGFPSVLGGGVVGGGVVGVGGGEVVGDEVGGLDVVVTTLDVVVVTGPAVVVGAIGSLAVPVTVLAPVDGGGLAGGPAGERGSAGTEPGVSGGAGPMIASTSGSRS